MNFPPVLSRYSTRWALGLGLLAALSGCDDRLAGSSVTTGNPTEIQVALTENGSPAAFTGRVEIHGATQIPVPGFSPEPLASFELKGASVLRLAAASFAGIADSAWPVGSALGDSVRLFNVVITGANSGAIVSELEYRKKEGTFGVSDHNSLPEGQSVLGVKANLAGLTSLTGRISPETLYFLKDHYVFIPGTSAFALADSGRFELKGIPKGKYSPALVSVWRKGQFNSGTQDSLEVFSLSQEMDTDITDTVSVGGVISVIPVPAAHRP